MILSVGEILADMVGKYEQDGLKFNAYLGGAPFNVAVNAKRAGAKVGFLGRVGQDVLGRFCREEAQKYGLDSLDIQIDDKRNTTIAFVSLKDGERDFAFNRCDTADFNIDLDSVDFSRYRDLKIIHLGSLMLSEKRGIDLAEKVAAKAEKLGAKLSFDLNFRTDIFGSVENAKSAYKPFIDRADILKFSDDELAGFTGENNADKAVERFTKGDKLVVVTFGSKGSACYFRGKKFFVPTEKVKPVDTTGAGDAFFGTFLAHIERGGYTEESIVNAMEKGNRAGALTTQFMGAIKL